MNSKTRPGARTANGFEAPPITSKEFAAFQTLVVKETGIFMAPAKQDLLRGRLRKRLAHHGLTSFSEYYDLICRRDSSGMELVELINAVTTNKTDFFRESHHFTFLEEQAFPEFEELAKTSGSKRLRIWSAACSSGEEPYSIAMTATDYFKGKHGWDIRILASDIDSGCLKKAMQGTYPESRIEQLPLELKKKGFLKGKGESAGTVRVRQELRDLVTFRRINFAENAWPIKTKFDVIFCRNAMIYFERDFQEQLVRRFLQYLNPHGYLVFGHSENLTQMKELSFLGKTIYRPSAAGKGNSLGSQRTLSQSTPKPQLPVASQAALVQKQIVQKQNKPIKKMEKKSIVAGEVFASNKSMEISTLLGSCIAACLYDPTVKAGGMNHFLLPEGDGDRAETACYGINAMELLINEIMMLGGQRDRMVAKLYGGAHVMGDQLQSSQVGQKNVDFVRSYLTTEGIPIVEQKVGGKQALRVVMAADEGTVRAVELEAARSEKLVPKDESALRQANRSAEVEDVEKITLF